MTHRWSLNLPSAAENQERQRDEQHERDDRPEPLDSFLRRTMAELLPNKLIIIELFIIQPDIAFIRIAAPARLLACTALGTTFRAAGHLGSADWAVEVFRWGLATGHCLLIGADFANGTDECFGPRLQRLPVAISKNIA
jgi:hypothetical protein